MKNLKNLFLFVFVCFIVSGYAQSGDLNWQPVRSTDGKVLFSLPLPQGWDVVGTPGNNEPFIKGPQGIKVISAPPEAFVCEVPLNQIQEVKKMGLPIVEVQPLEQIAQQNLRPIAENNGGQFIRSYSIPRIERVETRRIQNIASSLGLRLLEVDMLATEWTAPDDRKLLITLSSFKVKDRTGLSQWFLCMTNMDAPAEIFEKAKEVLFTALGNMQFDNQSLSQTNAMGRAESVGSQY